MRFLVDADMPRSSARLLQSIGHEAVDVRDIGLETAPDEEVFKRAQEEARIILTADLDFADIRRYRPGSHSGIVVFRLPHFFNAMQINRILERFIQSTKQESIQGALVIVEPVQVRVRR